MKFVKKYLFVLIMFLAGQFFAAHLIYNQVSQSALGQPNLNESIDKWIERLGPGDAGTYLAVAKNIVQGKGVNTYCSSCQPPSYSPFVFWGPGTPFFLSIGLRVFGLDYARSLFYWYLAVSLMYSSIMVIVSFLIIKKTFTRGITAFLVSYIPQIHGYFGPTLLSASEIACLIPFAVFYLSYFLQMISLNEIRRSNSKIYFYPALMGISLGLVSLIRDSNVVFGYFLALFLLLVFIRSKQTIKKDKILIPTIFITSLIVTITPVKIWNKYRIGTPVVSSSGSGAIWRYGLWSKHDAVDWYITSGIGFGQFLDPEAAIRVENAYREGKGSALFSLKELIKAVFRSPLNALDFKLKRMSVLWLGTREAPYIEWTLTSLTSFFFLCSFFAFIFLSRKNKSIPREPFVSYFVFLFLASFLIHSEFRYSQPVWMVLQFTPAILIEILWTQYKNKWRCCT